MKTNDELLIDYLRVESDKIKATNKSFNEMIIANHEKRNKDSNLIAKLKAEIKRLQKGNDYYYTLNRGVIAENDKLKEENNELKAECWCGCNDDLKAEYESIQDQLKACVNDYEEIEAENKGLKETINVDDADYNSLHDKYDALLVANGELLQSNIRLRSA